MLKWKCKIFRLEFNQTEFNLHLYPLVSYNINIMYTCGDCAYMYIIIVTMYIKKYIVFKRYICMICTFAKIYKRLQYTYS